MLIEFSVGNYRSFLEPVTLSMLAAPLRAEDPTLDENNVAEIDGLKLLRSAAIYGANASGKSNLVSAMRFMRQFVLNSSRESQAGEPIPADRFRLSTVAGTQPAHLQMIFCLEGIRYRYGFEVDDQRVHAEWLYRTVHREVRLFVREGDDYDISGQFKGGKGLEGRVRNNALFLSVAAQFNAELATELLQWFRAGLRVISGLQDGEYMGFTLSRVEGNERIRKRVLAFIREADLGISDVRVEMKPVMEDEVRHSLTSFLEQLTRSRPTESGVPAEITGLRVIRVETEHQLYDGEHQPVGSVVFELGEQESAGTQKLFGLSGPLFDVLDNGRVLVVDEMEARLHPVLTRAIISLFNSAKSNPKNAQFVFVTHDTGLLSKRLFRRDQIWFTEKDRYGATALYSLAELQVRNDRSYDKDYFAGRYGAVPFIGGLQSLFEEESRGATTETERT